MNKVGEITGKLAHKTERKMHVILDIALANGHDSVVLSAFGCGAYNNPPRHIAKLFRNVIKKYEGAFKCIAFAILNVGVNVLFCCFLILVSS